VHAVATGVFAAEVIEEAGRDERDPLLSPDADLVELAARRRMAEVGGPAERGAQRIGQLLDPLLQALSDGAEVAQIRGREQLGAVEQLCALGAVADFEGQKAR
jgi:hypothetical protein